MSELQLSVDTSQDMEWLIQAVADVANASEADLTAMQSKTWYHRLWEIVSFSKDNQIRTANGVTNLAKLPDILVRVMVMLSQTNTVLSDSIKENSQEIMRLAEFDGQLLQALKKHIYGKHEGIEFSDLAAEKQKLVADLLVLSDYEEMKTDASKSYISAIMRVAGMSGIDNQVGASAVASLTPKEQELLYRMIVTNRYLSGIDQEADSDIVDEIAISRKRRKDIQLSVQETAKHTTPDFFASLYEEAAYTYDLIEDNGIEFEEAYDMSVEAVPALTPDQFEEITLSGIVHIPSGDTRVFKNQTIHMQAMIHCEGSLEFDNCVIHYAETGASGEIDFSGTGSFVMRNCTIEGHSFDKKFFVWIKKKDAQAIFENCKFLNCSSLLNAYASIEMISCMIKNPGPQFIQSYLPLGKMDSCSFIFTEEPSFITTSFQQSREPSISLRAIKKDNVFLISRCTFEGDLKVDDQTEKLFQTLTSHLSSSNEKIREKEIISGNIVVEHCSFNGVRCIFGSVRKIANSTFIHCHRVVEGSSSGNDTLIEDCSFNFCANIGLNLQPNSVVKHSKMNHCFGELFSTAYSGGIVIEWCEFSNWEAPKRKHSDKSKDVQRLLEDVHPKAAITLQRSDYSGCSASCIRNCTFNNVVAHNYFLIKGSALRNLIGEYAGFVQNCSFANCITGRESGKLIKEWDTYFGLFDKKKDQKVVCISSCMGLDSVKIMK